MLSYRHAFHAGNHADVLKHLVLFLVLRYFNSKNKPYWYIDTHAGAGLYSLLDEKSQKTSEYQDGIQRIKSAGKNLCEPLAAFLQQLNCILPDDNHYAGSPYIALHTACSGTKHRLFELHSSDFPLLQQAIGDNKNTIIKNTDGFHGLIATIPPPCKRAVVLIDPPYETNDDYHLVQKTLQNAIKRFATGCYLIWYPQLNKIESKSLPEKLCNITSRYLHAVLTVKSPSQDGFGMMGSGMVVINPPYVLHNELQVALPQLTCLLAQDSSANYKLDILAS
ncbi:MAG: 23S rRNA (adenine(2030)-N(6))-methyltransferase RlmJ [Neisseriaceae bacterium]|nr:23S rRNA (adenine(2030)-N(6))-methyltransferase RlmJ [Neisseriaceae bacterium]